MMADTHYSQCPKCQGCVCVVCDSLKEKFPKDFNTVYASAKRLGGQVLTCEAEDIRSGKVPFCRCRKGGPA